MRLVAFFIVFALDFVTSRALHSQTAVEAFESVKANSEIIRKFDVLVKTEELEDQVNGGRDRTIFRRLLFDVDREVALSLTSEKAESFVPDENSGTVYSFTGVLIKGATLVAFGPSGKMTTKSQSFAQAIWKAQAQPYNSLACTLIHQAA